MPLQMQGTITRYIVCTALHCLLVPLLVAAASIRYFAWLVPDSTNHWRASSRCASTGTYSGLRDDTTRCSASSAGAFPLRCSSLICFNPAAVSTPAACTAPLFFPPGPRGGHTHKVPMNRRVQMAAARVISTQLDARTQPRGNRRKKNTEKTGKKGRNTTSSPASSSGYTTKAREANSRHRHGSLGPSRPDLSLSLPVTAARNEWMARDAELDRVWLPFEGLTRMKRLVRTLLFVFCRARA